MSQLIYARYVVVVRDMDTNELRERETYPLVEDMDHPPAECPYENDTFAAFVCKWEDEALDADVLHFACEIADEEWKHGHTWKVSQVSWNGKQPTEDETEWKGQADRPEGDNVCDGCEYF